MNTVYRIIWSAVTQSWVVVSELATSCGKQKSSAVRAITSTVGLCIGLGVFSAHAADYSSTVSGDFTFPAGETSTITTTDSPGVSADAGITISSSNDLIILTDGNNGSGAVARNGGIFNFLNVDIATNGLSAYGLYAQNQNSTITGLGKTTILTKALSSSGVIASNGGNIYLVDSDITTEGSRSPGLSSLGANSTITTTGATIIHTKLDSSTGVNAETGGAVNIAGADITTEGDGSVGLSAQEAGSAISSTGMVDINTSGTTSHAVLAQQGSAINLTDARLTTTGNDSTGIYAIYSGSVITATGLTTINTSGTRAHGIHTQLDGVVNLNNVDITTSGAASGVYAYGGTINSTGTITVHSSGANGHGIRANNGGVLNLSNTDVTTTGESAYSLTASNQGVINITGDTTVRASGAGSMGIFANGTGSTINLGSGDVHVQTAGDYNINTGYFTHGLLAESGGAITSNGNVVVTTTNTSASGVFARNAGSSLHLTNLTATTSGYGAIGLLARQGASVNISGDTTLTTNGSNASGVNAADSGSLVTVNNLNVTTTDKNSNNNAAGLSAFDGGKVISTGTTIIRTASGRGIWSSGTDAVINLVDADVATTDSNAVGMQADYGGSITSTGSTTIDTVGAGAIGIFANGNGSNIALTNALSVRTAGDSAHGIRQHGAAQVNVNGGSVITSGTNAHGFTTTGGATKTFDGSAGNVLPTIQVSGAGSAMLDANGTGSRITLDNQTLNISGASIADTWGAKAEGSGQIIFNQGTTGGTGLWATGTGSRIALSGTNANGSRVLLVSGGTLSVDPVGSTIGSLEGDSSGLVSSSLSDGSLAIGVNNATNNGSLIDNANFAGVFTNVGSLTKTGSLTQILSGIGNTVGSVNVTGGTLAFHQVGAFTTTGSYTTHAGATTRIGMDNSTLVVGDKFTQAKDSTLNITLGASPDITADTSSLDGQLIINGFSDTTEPVRSSEVTNNTYTLIHTANGITGDFVNNPLVQTGLDYLLHDGHLSTDSKDYNLSFRLAWNEGLQSKSTGSFTLNEGTAFNVDTVLSDQTLPAGGFTSGWDGKSLTKTGEGLLILSALNTYTGKTTLNGGALRTDTVDSLASSDELTINSGVFDLNNNNQRANRLGGAGGEVRLNGAMLTVNNETAADNTTYTGDIVDGSSKGRLTKTGDGTLTLSGNTGWTGETQIEGGELVLDGSNGGAQLVSNIIGKDNTALSLRNGAMLTGWIDPTDISIDTSSSWNMTADSVVDAVNLAGTINFVAPSSLPMNTGHTLTANSWHGQGGTVVLNTVLGDDASATDKIVVNGDTSGNTFMRVNNVGGGGAQTVEGIRVVEVNGVSDGIFTKSGRIVAGAYDYSLVKKGSDWFLTSLYVTSPVDPETPVDPVLPVDPGTPVTPRSPDAPVQPGISVVRPESASYTANLAAANTMFITRLHDRLGEPQYTDVLTGEKKVTSMWLRQVGGHNRWKDSSGQMSTQSNRYVIQLGGDIAQWSSDDLQRLHLGVMAGYGKDNSNSHSNVTGYHSQGSVNGYSTGLYATWYQNDETKQGMYLDSWAQYGWFSNDVNGQDIQGESYDSSGITASLEAGYTHRLGEFTGSKGGLNEWFIQPQVQAIWMGIKADDHRESNGTRVSSEGDGNLQTRLGLRTYLKGHSKIDDGKNRTFQPFVEVNWIHNTQDFGTRMDGVNLYQDGARNIGEIKTGVEGKLNSRLNLWGNVGVQIGDKGYSDSSAMVGVKYSF